LLLLVAAWGCQPAIRYSCVSLVADPADLAPQHCVLVPEHEELGILGHLTPGQHHLTAEQTANEQVDDREHHSAMIPTRLPAQARSSNRAPQVPRLVLIGFTLAVSALGVLINDVRNSSGIAGAVTAIVMVTALSFALWWWVSWKLPHPPAPARALIPGALLMAIGADVLHLLTTYWIGHLVARKTHTYGAVGIALAVLLWVYILGRIIVASAGLNAALLHRRQNR
jgi:hypothetical protein